MDLELLRWIHANWHQSDIVNQIMKCITISGNGGIIWIVTGVLLLLFRKTRIPGLVMLISLAAGFILNDLILKPLVARQRPFLEDVSFCSFLAEIGLKEPTGYSFPSGHSFSSLNCAVVLTFFFKKKGMPFLLYALLIAFSRAFVLVHYPSDILMGMIFGIMTAVTTIAVYRKIAEKAEGKKKGDRITQS